MVHICKTDLVLPNCGEDNEVLNRVVIKKLLNDLEEDCVTVKESARRKKDKLLRSQTCWQ